VAKIAAIGLHDRLHRAERRVGIAKLNFRSRHLTPPRHCQVGKGKENQRKERTSFLNKKKQKNFISFGFGLFHHHAKRSNILN
jgi:hypothetical protein